MKKIILAFVLVVGISLSFSFSSPSPKLIQKTFITSISDGPTPKVHDNIKDYVTDWVHSTPSDELNAHYMEQFSPEERARLCSTVMYYEPGGLCRFYYIIYNCQTGDVLYAVLVL